jgi:hypothetical protein
MPATKEAENYFYRKIQRNVKSKIVQNKNHLFSLVTIIINLNFHT